MLILSCPFNLSMHEWEGAMATETGEESSTDSSNFRKKVGFAAIVGAVSALAGLFGALATLYTQVEPVVAAAIKRDFAPVGTIVASILEPKDFAIAVGEHEGDAYTKRKWILPDGREVIDTAYARSTGNKPVPNLQGMFLRGIDLKNKREPGDFQHFSTARPTNDFTATSQEVMIPSGVGDKYNAGGQNYFVPHQSPVSFKLTGGGDAETRPDNVSVYYYIKIN